MTATNNIYAIDFTHDGEFICTEFVCATSPEDALERVEAEGLVPPMIYEVSITAL